MTEITRDEKDKKKHGMMGNIGEMTEKISLEMACRRDILFVVRFDERRMVFQFL